jgi:hypothetical protein
VAAFSANALSDLSPTGKPRHKVLLVPFDDRPGTTLSVTSIPEVIAMLSDYQNNLKNTGGRTDIQKALMQAMSLIAEAENRNQEPLAAANIILMTDGQSEIDAEKLRMARKAIDRHTPLQVMFIALGSSNQDLMSFALDSTQMGAEHGFYREFTREHMKDLLTESERPITPNKNYFHTTLSFADLPTSTLPLVKKAYELAKNFSETIYNTKQNGDSESPLQRFDQKKLGTLERVNRPLESWIVKLRQLMQLPIFHDDRISHAVINDLIDHFERLTGIAFLDLSKYEQAQLRHLMTDNL